MSEYIRIEKPTAYEHLIRVPVGGGAVHFVPNLWDSETKNNLVRMLLHDKAGHGTAATIIESVDYLFSPEITQTEAIRRLKIIRNAVRSIVGSPRQKQTKVMPTRIPHATVYEQLTGSPEHD